MSFVKAANLAGPEHRAQVQRRHKLPGPVQPLLLSALAPHSVAYPIFLIPLAETGGKGTEQPGSEVLDEFICESHRGFLLVLFPAF